MTPREKLLESIRRRNLIVVAGTGVSTALSNRAPASSWIGLLKDGAARVGVRDGDTGTLLDISISMAKDATALASIAGNIKHHLGPDFGRWIDSTVGQLEVVDDTLALAIKALDSPIFTTNYDILLEKSLKMGSASWTNPSLMRQIVVGNREIIGHLHGTCDDPDKVIFSETDYHTIVSSEPAQQIQQAIFTVKSMLFVGVGEGLGDPNFDPMIKKFENGFEGASYTHFRLCLNSDVRPDTELASVVDIGYGDSHADLAGFLDSLAQDARIDSLQLADNARQSLTEQVRENTTIWREAETVEEKDFSELVIEPTFLPAPHNEYATTNTLDAKKDRRSPVETETILDATGIVLVAGEENAGVSTALAYLLNEAMDRFAGCHSVLIDSPLKTGSHPVKSAIARQYKSWGCLEPQDAAEVILGIDNLRFEESTRYRRASEDIVSSAARLKLLGVRQTDAVEIAETFRSAGLEVTMVYLGRFSRNEALQLAKRVAPQRAEEVARDAMTIVRDKNLPRTPFTIILLVELVQSGMPLGNEESEIAILNRYLDFLLEADFARVARTRGMNARNKRKVLETIARKFVEVGEDQADYADVVKWVSDLFSQLGWDSYNVKSCLDELVGRRLLASTGNNKIRFQRSTYLELMAGLAAKDDASFRSLVFKNPLRMASIVRSYAAMARSDEIVLEVVEKEIERIHERTPSGTIFHRVRQVEAKDEPFSDRSESDETQDSDTDTGGNSVERSGIDRKTYDDSSDEDSPAFLTTRLDDLSAARIAMLVVDLASKVIRDSDEVMNQELKRRVLHRLMLAWAAFTDLYQTELTSTDGIRSVAESILAHDGDEPNPEQIDDFESFLTKVIPVVLVDSGITVCLASPTLRSRLSDLEFPDTPSGRAAEGMRVLALLHSGGSAWVDALVKLSDENVRTYFVSSFLASRARFEYLTNPDLSDVDLDRIRGFLRRVMEARYTFRNQNHKNSVLNRFEDKLRKDQLDRTRVNHLEISE
ncbi:MAG: SIR2 family protein [Arthrobacter sp.]|jgi:hypothetical protein|nr:SIR2 family protein [Arthrobacter sp.]